MTSLVFVPVDRAEALALRAGADLGDRPGCAPTAGLAGGLEPTAVAEEVEFAALSQAGVLALRAGADPLRLVLAADVADDEVTDRGSELGEVNVAGVSLVEAAAIEAVAALQGEFDLLWFAPDELDRLPL
jgi:hypothetical protein